MEEDESFSVILGSSDNGVGVDPTPLTVVILNNDCECFEGYIVLYVHIICMQLCFERYSLFPVSVESVCLIM